MMYRTRTITLTTSLALLFGVASTSAQDGAYEILTDIVRHETTEDIHVWAPEGEGPFPIVYAIHGSADLVGGDWDVIGTALAQHGVVVFAPDYHATDRFTGRWDRISSEMECSYRFAHEVAADFGGDVEQPIAFIGHSLGATLALTGGLDLAGGYLAPGGTFNECFAGVPRADVIIGLAGCHYEAPQEGLAFDFDPQIYDDTDATIVLVGGENDEVCPAWQSKDAAEALTAVGHRATAVEIPDATHFSLIGHEVVDGEWVTLADGPAPAQVVQVTLDSIRDVADAGD